MATIVQAAADADMAEALSRVAEARASVFRGAAARSKLDGEAFEGPADEASSQAAEFGRRAVEMRPSGAIDPEGTPYPLADRRGSFAENADIANQGGIGVFDSNTRELEEGEGTPNSRLHPEIAYGTPFAPSVEENNLNDLMPEGGETSQEEQEEYELQRLRMNFGAGMVLPVGSSEDEGDQPAKKRRGRPAKKSSSKAAE